MGIQLDFVQPTPAARYEKKIRCLNSGLNNHPVSVMEGSFVFFLSFIQFSIQYSVTSVPKKTLGVPDVQGEGEHHN